MKRSSDFASRLKIVMDELKCNYEQLGAKLQMQPQTLNRYILSQRVPKVNIANEMAAKLEVNPLWLQGYDVDMHADFPDGAYSYSKGSRIPIIGTVKAGYNGVAFEEYEGYDYAEVSRPEDYIYFKVKGDSMEPRIHNGDLALVRKQPDVLSGELAVVIINGEEGTLKKVIKHEGTIVLQPFNSDYKPEIITGEKLNDIHIIGRVVETKTKW